jgi:hypothetical protein
MRRASVRVGIFGLLAVLAGCSSGSSSTTTPMGGGPITKAQATAYAHAINLRAGDLPGTRSLTSEHEEPPTPPARDVGRCDGGVSSNVAVVNVASPQFAAAGQGQFISFGSATVVLPTAALASRSITADSSARGLACVARLLPLAVTTPGVQFGRFTITRLATTLPRGARGYAVRLSGTAHPQAEPTKGTRYYLDALAVVSGPAEIGLIAVGVQRPPSSQAEEHLLALLYSRAQANKL